MKTNPKHKRRVIAEQDPHGFAIPTAAQFERWYGPDIVAAITKIRKEHTDTDSAIIRDSLDSLLQEAQEGNKFAREMLAFLTQDLTETVRIIESDLDEEIKNRLLHARQCATKAFLDSLESE